MDCSYCCVPLPDDEESVPNVIVHNTKMVPFLYLHAECIHEVINGLKYSETLVVN